MTTYRTDAAGFAVCPHRDLSVCQPCAAADPLLVEVSGAWFLCADETEKQALVQELAAIREAYA